MCGPGLAIVSHSIPVFVHATTKHQFVPGANQNLSSPPLFFIWKKFWPQTFAGGESNGLQTPAASLTGLNDRSGATGEGRGW